MFLQIRLFGEVLSCNFEEPQKNKGGISIVAARARAPKRPIFYYCKIFHKIRCVPKMWVSISNSQPLSPPPPLPQPPPLIPAQTSTLDFYFLSRMWCRTAFVCHCGGYEQEQLIATLLATQAMAATQASSFSDELGSAKAELASYMSAIELDRRLEL